MRWFELSALNETFAVALDIFVYFKPKLPLTNFAKQFVARDARLLNRRENCEVFLVKVFEA